MIVRKGPATQGYPSMLERRSSCPEGSRAAGGNVGAMLRLVATSSVPRLSSRGTALAARRCSGAAPDERSLFERLRDSIRTPRAGVRTGRRLVGTDDRGNRYFVIPATVRTHGGAAAGEVREVVFPDDYDTAEYHPSHVRAVLPVAGGDSRDGPRMVHRYPSSGSSGSRSRRWSRPLPPPSRRRRPRSSRQGSSSSRR